MKKNFFAILMLSFSLFSLPLQQVYSAPVDEEEEELDFDKFMQNLFGPPPGSPAPGKTAPVKTSPGKTSQAKQALGKAASPAISPAMREGEDKEKTEKETKAEQRKKSNKLMRNLILLQKQLTIVTNATQSDIFTPEFRENIAPLLQAASSKHESTARKSSSEKASSSNEDIYTAQGPVGVNVLIGELKKTTRGIKHIQAGTIYRELLVSDEFKTLPSLVDKIGLKLSDFRHDIKELQQKQKALNLDEAESLKRLLLPKEKRNTSKTETTYIQKRNDLQTRLHMFYKSDVTALLKQLRLIVTHPKARETIEKKVKTQEELAKQAEQRQKLPYSSQYSGSPSFDRPHYDGGFPWAQKPYQYGEGSEPQTGFPEKKPETTEKDTATKADDANKGFGPGKRKDDKDKADKDKKAKEEELAKTDLVTLMQEATKLLEQISSGITPDVRETTKPYQIGKEQKQIIATLNLIDNKLEDTLTNNHDAIDDLHMRVAQIEKRKNTEEAEKDKKLKKWEEAEQAYHNAFVNHAISLVKLSKYGYAELAEDNETGRFVLKLSGEHDTIALSQKALRETYGLIKKALPQKQQEVVARKEKEFVEKTTPKVKELLAKIFIDLQRDVDKFEIKEQSLFALNAAKLERQKNTLHAILQLIITLQNSPLPIISFGLGEQTEELARNALTNLYMTTRSNFSPLLQQTLDKKQKEEGAGKLMKLLADGATLLNKSIPKLSSLMESNNADQWERFLQEPVAKESAQTPQTLGEADRELLTELHTSWQRDPDRHSRYKLECISQIYNQLDQLLALLAKLLPRAKWATKPTIYDNAKVEILDALWGENLAVDEKGFLINQNPQNIEVRTAIWQEKCNDALKGQTIKQEEGPISLGYQANGKQIAEEALEGVAALFSKTPPTPPAKILPGTITAAKPQGKDTSLEKEPSSAQAQQISPMSLILRYKVGTKIYFSKTYNASDQVLLTFRELKKRDLPTPPPAPKVSPAPTKVITIPLKEQLTKSSEALKKIVDGDGKGGKEESAAAPGKSGTEEEEWFDLEELPNEIVN